MTAFTAEPITQRTERLEVLADVFDLRFDTLPPAARQRLWDKVVEAHRGWQATQD